MNEIINKLLLVGDKFMQEMHLKQLALVIVLVVHLLKIKNRKIYANWKKRFYSKK